MRAEKFGAVMGVLVEQIVRLITENDVYDEMTASNEFYNSKVYALLEQEDAKLWNFSPLTLFNMFDEEKRQVVLNCRRRFDDEQSRGIYDLLRRAV